MLSRNKLKIIAVIAMLLDHVGWMFFGADHPAGFVMRVIGRLAAPVMCMFLAQGYEHTSSVKKYAVRLLIFGLISQPFYAFSHGSGILTADFNMILTLFLSFLILIIYDKMDNEFLKFVLIAVCFAFSYFCDWGIIAPLWVLGFYIYRENKEKQTAMFLIVSVVYIISCVLSGFRDGLSWYSQLWQAGLFLFVPLIFLYNGEGGRKSAFAKWFFYLFYPLHLGALELINRCVSR